MKGTTPPWAALTDTTESQLGWTRSCFVFDITKLVGDARIFAFADKLDLKLAAEARRKGCVYCKGILYSAAYFRSPRHSQVIGKVRFYGLCCSKEGCRRRTNPKSIRFAGKSPYNTSFFLILRLLSSGPSKRNWGSWAPTCEKLRLEIHRLITYVLH